MLPPPPPPPVPQEVTESFVQAPRSSLTATASVISNQTITGDLTHGFSLFGAATWSHLSGDFKDSPIVDLRGSSSQWLTAIGLAYTW